MTDEPAGRRVRAGVSLDHALSGACRIADRRRSDAVVGGGQVLVSLVRRLPGAWTALGTSLGGLRRALAAAPATGEPTVDDPADDPAGGSPVRAPGDADGGDGQRALDLELEVDGALREARWSVFSADPAPRRYAGPNPPRFTLEVRDAVRRSLVRAAADGVRWAGGEYLLDALLADPRGTAHRLLVERGAEPGRLRDAVHRAVGGPKDDQPPTWAADTLRWFGAASRDRPAGRLGRLIGAMATRRSGTGVVVRLLDRAAAGGAVRLGHRTLTTAHLLLAVLAFDEQLALDERVRPDRPLPPALLAANRGGAILAAHGVDHATVLRRLATESGLDEPEPDGGAERPGRRSGRRRGGGRPRPAGPLEPAWSAPALAAHTDISAADRSPNADQPPNGGAGSTRLLVAALAPPDAAAARLLRGLHVNPATVAAEAGLLL